MQTKSTVAMLVHNYRAVLKKCFWANIMGRQEALKSLGSLVNKSALAGLLVAGMTGLAGQIDVNSESGAVAIHSQTSECMATQDMSDPFVQAADDEFCADHTISGTAGATGDVTNGTKNATKTDNVYTWESGDIQGSAGWPKNVIGGLSIEEGYTVKISSDPWLALEINNTSQLTGTGILEVNRVNNGAYISMININSATDFSGTLKLSATGTATNLVGYISANAANMTVDLASSAKALIISGENVSLAGLNGVADSFVRSFAFQNYTNSAANSSNYNKDNDATARSLTIGGAGTYSFAGALGSTVNSSSLNLIKTGTGTQKFTGAVNTGNITVSGGTLDVSESTSFTATKVTLAGGTFKGTIGTGVKLDATQASNMTGLTLNGGTIVFSDAMVATGTNTPFLTLGTGILTAANIDVSSLGEVYTNLAAGASLKLISGVDSVANLTTILGTNVGTLALDSGNLIFTKTATSDFTWNAANDSIWKVGTDFGVTLYADAGAMVTFGNLTADETVTIDGTVAPVSITVDPGAEKVYTFNVENGGMISGSTTLAVNSGKMILNGNHTFTGVTTIATGAILALGGTISSSITNNGALEFANTEAMTFANTLTGTGTIKQTGTGTTTITADVRGKDIIIDAGTVQLNITTVNGKRMPELVKSVSGVGTFRIANGSASDKDMESGFDGTAIDYSGFTGTLELDGNGNKMRFTAGTFNGTPAGMTIKMGEGVQFFGDNTTYNSNFIFDGDSGSANTKSWGNEGFGVIRGAGLIFKGSVTITDDSNLLISGGTGNITFNNKVIGTNATFTLGGYHNSNGANTYIFNGETNLGTLKFNKTNATATFNNTATVANLNGTAGTIFLNKEVTVESGTYSGSFLGEGALIKTSAEKTLNLTGATFGATTIKVQEGSVNFGTNDLSMVIIDMLGGSINEGVSLGTMAFLGLHNETILPTGISFKANSGVVLDSDVTLISTDGTIFNLGTTVLPLHTQSVIAGTGRVEYSVNANAGNHYNDGLADSAVTVAYTRTENGIFTFDQETTFTGHLTGWSQVAINAETTFTQNVTTAIRTLALKDDLILKNGASIADGVRVEGTGSILIDIISYTPENDIAILGASVIRQNGISLSIEEGGELALGDYNLGTGLTALQVNKGDAAGIAGETGFDFGDYNLKLNNGILTVGLAAGGDLTALSWDSAWNLTTTPTLGKSFTVEAATANPVNFMANTDYERTIDGKTAVVVAVVGNDGAANIRLYGGYGSGVQNSTKDSWLSISGGTFDLVNGGSEYVWGGNKPTFTGDSHIKLSGETTSVNNIIGGNSKGGSFIGDSYIQIEGGAQVVGHIIGGSTSNHSQLSAFDGDSCIVIRNVQTGAGAALVDINLNAVIGGSAYSSNVSSSIAFNGDSNILIEHNEDATGTFSKTIIAGSYSKQGTNTHNGNSSLTINSVEGVTFASKILGGSWQGGGTLTQTGDTHITLNGGTYTSYITAAGQSTTLNGNSTLILKAGTFSTALDFIAFGGMDGTSSISGNTLVDISGAVKITSTGSIYAGSSAAGTIGGNTQVIIRDVTIGSELVNFTGTIDGGNRGGVGTITGKKILTFDNVKAPLQANITNFDTFQFHNGTVLALSSLANITAEIDETSALILGSETASTITNANLTNNGTLSIDANITFTDSTIINNGTMSFESGSTVDFASLTNNGTVEVKTNLTGTTSLTLTGGTFDFTGDNSAYTATLTIAEGTTGIFRAMNSLAKVGGAGTVVFASDLATAGVITLDSDFSALTGKIDFTAVAAEGITQVEVGNSLSLGVGAIVQGQGGQVVNFGNGWELTIGTSTYNATSENRGELLNIFVDFDDLIGLFKTYVIGDETEEFTGTAWDYDYVNNTSLAGLLPNEKVQIINGSETTPFIIGTSGADLSVKLLSLVTIGDDDHAGYVEINDKSKLNVKKVSLTSTSVLNINTTDNLAYDDGEGDQGLTSIIGSGTVKFAQDFSITANNFDGFTGTLTSNNKKLTISNATLGAAMTGFSEIEVAGTGTTLNKSVDVATLNVTGSLTSGDNFTFANKLSGAGTITNGTFSGNAGSDFSGTASGNLNLTSSQAFANATVTGKVNVSGTGTKIGTINNVDTTLTLTVSEAAKTAAIVDITTLNIASANVVNNDSRSVEGRFALISLDANTDVTGFTINVNNKTISLEKSYETNVYKYILTFEDGTLWLDASSTYTDPTGEVVDEFNSAPVVAGQVQQVINTAGMINNAISEHLTQAVITPNYSDLLTSLKNIDGMQASTEGGVQIITQNIESVGTNVWGQALYSYAEHDGVRKGLDSDENSYGGMIGIERVYQDFSYGAFIGGVSSEVDGDNGYNVESEAIYAGLYTGVHGEIFFANAGVMLGYSFNDTERPSVLQDIEGDYDSWMTNVFGEIGAFHHFTENIYGRASVGMQYSYVKAEDYQESEGGNAVDSCDFDSLTVGVDVRLGYRFAQSYLELRAGVTTELLDTEIDSDFRIIDNPGTLYTSQGGELDENKFILGVEGGHRFNDNLEFRAGVLGEFGDSHERYTGNVRLIYSF